jgi:tetratricopeptide (TPR) repeat protein
MSAEVHAFLPFTVRLEQDVPALRTTVTISGSPSKLFRTTALVAGVAADVAADRLFLSTANSNQADTATLFGLSLATGGLLWRIGEVQPGGAITLNSHERYVTAGRPYGTTDPYLVKVSYDGVELERHAASGYALVSLGRDAAERGDRLTAASLLERALKSEISPNTKADVLRDLGDMLREEGRIAEAVAQYERALSFNPKVAVRSRLKALKK